MARDDHYLSQTYMRSFTNEAGKVWAYNKRWGTAKELATKSICWESDGSDNPYFQKDRIIEDYLRIFENGWKKALEVFASPKPTLKDYMEAKFILSGYIAYLRFFPPGPAQAGQQFLEETVKSEARILARAGELPPPPEGYEFLLDWVLEGKIRVDVDKKFAQAQGIQAMIATSRRFYGSPWMRVTNGESIPFLTSDNPACMWHPRPSSDGIIYFPTSPTTAVLIQPFKSQGDDYDHTMDAEGPSLPGAATEFNSLIIKCAEKYVISSVRSKDTLDQVEGLKDWRYRCVTEVRRIGKGELLVPTLKPLPNQVEA